MGVPPPVLRVRAGKLIEGVVPLGQLQDGLRPGEADTQDTMAKFSDVVTQRQSFGTRAGGRRRIGIGPQETMAEFTYVGTQR